MLGVGYQVATSDDASQTIPIYFCESPWKQPFNRAISPITGAWLSLHRMLDRCSGLHESVFCIALPSGYSALP